MGVVNKTNYELLRENQIKNGLRGKRLLLHSCCAPCSTTCLERLAPFFDITVYYYNPNIESEEEYQKRASEQERFLREAYPNVKLVVVPYDSTPFYSASKGLEEYKEGGLRCKNCFELRLGGAVNFAVKNAFDCVTTTLTLSPLKNAQLLNTIGEQLCNNNSLTWIFSDFKKQGGVLRSVELSKQHQLYRQNYCGCVFSKRQSEQAQND